MKLRQFKQGAITLLAPTEAIIEDSVTELSRKIKACLDAGETKVIIDFSSVSFIDSKGLEMLLDYLDLSMKVGGSIKIASPNQICSDIFRVTRLSNFFEVYKEIDDARRSFL